MPSSRARLLATVVGALALAPAALAAPIENEAALWGDPQTRYVIVGETHGTTETPAFFGDLACEAHLSGRSIVVAVEVGESSQTAIDTFLASDGGSAARSRFLADQNWTAPFKDGRSSRAYLALFEQLRTCLSAHRIAAVRAIQPAIYGRPQSDANAAMAALLERAATLRKGALVVALMGNFHARKGLQSFDGQTITPAAADLPSQETLSLVVTTGGSAWNCLDTHQLRHPPARRRSSPPTISIPGRCGRRL